MGVEIQLFECYT